MRRAWLLSALILFSSVSPQAAQSESATGAPDSWPAPMGKMLYYFVVADQLEFHFNEGHDELRWEIEGWVGGDKHRMWLETEGEGQTSERFAGDAEFQLLYGRNIAAFWDVRAGARYDRIFGRGGNRDRAFAVLDVEGLAPFWFEVNPALFVSEEGDVSARLTATTDVLVTQRLILQPRVEVNAAVQAAREFELERGFNDIELGLRLRYELRREVAPYLGMHWERKLGRTAKLARDEGEGISEIGFVLGLRLWF